MFTITDIAAEKAKEVLVAEGKADWGLRIYIAGGSCCGPAYGMDLDQHPAEGDNVIEKNGLRVFTDKATTEKLAGMSVDFVDDGQHQGFVIKGDKPAPSCGSGGCGTGSSSCGTGSGGSCC